MYLSLNTALVRMLEPAASFFFGINFYFSWFVYKRNSTCKVVAWMCSPFSSKAAPVTRSVSPSCDLGRCALLHLGYLLVGGQHAPNLWGGSGKPVKIPVTESMNSARTLPVFILSLGHKNHRGPGMRAGALNQVSLSQCALRPLRLA